ncbi:hypothetical protein Hanom_Chr12g01072451 [Helianthus anomalus]
MRRMKMCCGDCMFHRWRSFLNGLTYRIDGNAVESDQPPLIGILFFYPLSCPNKGYLILRRECCSFNNGEYVKA